MEPGHKIYREHQHNLSQVLPIYHHGDEGRGKRRGNPVVVSIESPIGLHTSSKKGRRACGCQPPNSLQRKYATTNAGIPAHHKQRLMRQQTSMRGRSFLQHCLFTIPSAYHHEYPHLLDEMLQMIATELKSLFVRWIHCQRQELLCSFVWSERGFEMVYQNIQSHEEL